MKYKPIPGYMSIKYDLFISTRLRCTTHAIRVAITNLIGPVRLSNEEPHVDAIDAKCIDGNCNHRFLGENVTKADHNHCPISKIVSMLQMLCSHDKNMRRTECKVSPKKEG